MISNETAYNASLLLHAKFPMSEILFVRVPYLVSAAARSRSAWDPRNLRPSQIQQVMRELTLCVQPIQTPQAIIMFSLMMWSNGPSALAVRDFPSRIQEQHAICRHSPHAKVPGCSSSDLYRLCFCRSWGRTQSYESGSWPCKSCHSFCFPCLRLTLLLCLHSIVNIHGIMEHQNSSTREYLLRVSLFLL